MHRFMDKTGAKAFNNEDEYHGASVGSNVSVNLHVHALDSASFSQYAMDNAHIIGRAVKDHLDSTYSRSATATA
jgi:hypothetical protein